MDNKQEKKNVVNVGSEHTANKKIWEIMQARLSEAGLAIKGVKGGQSSDIYKPNIFEGTLPEERKKVRLKLRKLRDYHALLVKNATSATEREKACRLFSEFYENVYRVNDYSLNSICSGRTDETTKRVLSQVLDTVKKNLQK